MYSYRKSIKSDISDELINTYLLRPIAGIIVWALYYTPVTPNQVTITSTFVGLIAALFYLQGTSEAFLVAGLLITLKDLLDSADGQLARAKQQYSRIGRFLDSIGDFIVDAAVFSAIGWILYISSGNWLKLLFALLGLIGISLRVSYHVFYQVNFLHLQKQSANNRISEEIQEEDLKKGGNELILQRIFQCIYGWQDRLVEMVDRWSYGEGFQKLRENKLKNPSECTSSEPVLRSQKWYSDPISLRISGFLGFGTEFFLLMVCSVLDRLDLYLSLNIFLMNGILILCVIYRRFVLLKDLRMVKY
jgi:phosphatidylglycerophosphate synthase